MGEKTNKRNGKNKKHADMGVLKAILIIVIIAIIVVTVVICTVIIRDNQGHTLSEILNDNLEEVYVRGRIPIADEMLNYTYGAHLYASTLSDGNTTHDGHVYYDKDGNVKFTLDFLENNNQVYVNGEKYIYSTEGTGTKYKTKELYPDPNKNETEKFIYNIVKLFPNDNEYWWGDYKVAYNQSEYPQNFTNGTYFYNQGVSIVVLEYSDFSTCDEDYEIELERLKSWYNAEVTEEKENVTYLTGEDADFHYVAIKHNNLIISVEEISNESGKYTDEYNENIDLVENYLTEQGMLH